MTKDQVDELMRENGIVVVGEAVYILCNLVKAESAAAEREALETIIKQIKNDWEWAMDSQMKVYAAEYLLSVIRARGLDNMNKQAEKNGEEL